MKSFLYSLSLFLLPLVILGGIPFLLLYRGGELRSLDDIIERQALGEHTLYGKAHVSDYGEYTLQSVAKRRPAVLVLGSSRVLEFRKEFFTPETSFFNAGGSAQSVTAYTDFIEAMPNDWKPDVLLVGFDQYFFHPKWTTALMEADHKSRVVHPSSLSLYVNLWKSVGADILDGKISVVALVHPDSSRVGFNALFNENGLRDDGSYQYGEYLKNKNAAGYGLSDDFTNIENGTRRFDYGDTPSPDALFALDHFLRVAKSRNLPIVGFLSPYPHPIYESLQAKGDDYEYMKKLYPAMKKIYQTYGFSVYDFSDAGALGASDKEYIDGTHVSEKTIARLLLALATKELFVREHVDRKGLTALIEQAHSDISIVTMTAGAK